jgi:heavy metal sensor kinase
MSPRSIRARLTAWYALVLALALVVTGAITYTVVRRQIERSSDASVVSMGRSLTAGLIEEADEARGGLRLRSANELLAEYRDNDRAVILFTHDGREFAAHTSALARSIDRALIRRRIAANAFGFVTVDHHVRLYLSPMRAGGQSFVMTIARSLASQRETLADLRNAMLITAPLALLVASLGGYVLARKSLDPIVRMSVKAREIRATNLSERIEVINPHDELGELAATLNDLLAHLDQSFARQRRFMAEASHELRSPVAILQGELDVTLSRDDRDVAQYRESLEVMRRTVRRLTRIVRDLFLLARSDAGELPLKREPLYVDELVSQTVRAYKTVASEKDVALVAESGAEIFLRGDEDLLQRMIGNLVDNAIRHAPAGSEVSIRCVSDGDNARIEVRDRGAGVPQEAREQIFERFFRVDAARSASAGTGAGLGLPIARWIAEAHGGSLQLRMSNAEGSVFVATLPLLAVASGSSSI